jgi:hypothetical protein
VKPIIFTVSRLRVSVNILMVFIHIVRKCQDAMSTFPQTTMHVFNCHFRVTNVLNYTQAGDCIVLNWRCLLGNIQAFDSLMVIWK